MASWKTIRRQMRRPFETGVFLLLQTLVPLLPRGAVVGFSRLAGKLAWWFLPRERRIGLLNIDAVKGTDVWSQEI